MRRLERFKGVTVLLVLTIGFAMCSGPSQIRLTGSPETPAAQGTAKLKITDNGNVDIDMVVEHLAPPEKIDPGATAYVVWVRGTDRFAQAQNMGALVIDDNLKGEFKGGTPLHAFQLSVTAEPSRVSTIPSGKTVLSAQVQMK